jgi:hypothetical protein
MVTDFLSDFTICAGEALEREDKFIMEAGRARGESGGLLRSQQEKFYQFIVWKAVYSKWRAEVEKDSHDLVLLDPTDVKKYLCIFEMKNWLSASGLRERPHINRDIQVKLTQCISSDSAFILFSANNRGAAEEQLKFFERHAFPEIPNPRRKIHCFPTLHPDATEAEFWIAVWPIKSGPLFGQPPF